MMICKRESFLSKIKFIHLMSSDNIYARTEHEINIFILRPEKVSLLQIFMFRENVSS